MTTGIVAVTVWVLVTTAIDSHGGGSVTYSPPLVDLSACEFLQKNIPGQRYVSNRCIQINMAVTK
jgi:hypothetical protein